MTVKRPAAATTIIIIIIHRTIDPFRLPISPIATNFFLWFHWFSSIVYIAFLVSSRLFPLPHFVVSSCSSFCTNGNRSQSETVSHRHRHLQHWVTIWWESTASGTLLLSLFYKNQRTNQPINKVSIYHCSSLSHHFIFQSLHTPLCAAVVVDFIAAVAVVELSS